VQPPKSDDNVSEV